MLKIVISFLAWDERILKKFKGSLSACFLPNVESLVNAEQLYKANATIFHFTLVSQPVSVEGSG